MNRIQHFLLNVCGLTLLQTALFATFTGMVVFLYGNVWGLHMDTVFTIEDCVHDRWVEWEIIRVRMPTVEEESEFRDSCWEELGVKINGE